jgi:flagellar basal body rod protein FlgF
MSKTCLICGDPIDISVGGDVHFTVNTRQGGRESWRSYGRLHIDCLNEIAEKGQFNPHTWGEKDL